MWNAESYPWHECALKTSRGGPSRLTTFKPTRGPAFPARSGRSPVTTSSLKLLPRFAQGAPCGRGEGSRDISSNLAGAIGFTCVRRGFSTPPLLRRGSGRSGLYLLRSVSTARYWSFRAERSRDISTNLAGPSGPACLRGGFSTASLPPSGLRSKRPAFVGTCFPRPPPVMSSGATRSRDISTASATLIRDASPRRGFSTSPLFRRGSGRSGLYSLGRAFLARYWSCRAERSGAETHAGPKALGPRVEATWALQGLPSPALSLPFSSLALRPLSSRLSPLPRSYTPHARPHVPPRTYRSSPAISALTTATSTVI